MSSRRVQIYEGNGTLRRLMAGVLSDAGMVVHATDEEDGAADDVADLLVVDVDSGLPDVDGVTAGYRAEEKPVVFCGLRHSREEYSDENWIDRPFASNNFLDLCLDALGLSHDDLPEDGTPGPIASLENDEPITRELQYDEAVELEGRLGLEPGALGSENARTSEDTAYEILDLDEEEEELVIEVEELEYDLGQGGALTGEVQSRRIDTREIEKSRKDAAEARVIRRPTFSQTMPDSPSAMGDPDEESTLARDATDAPVPPEIEAEADRDAEIRGVARMLADSWHRIGMAARAGDRAERIERVLRALFSQGMRGAAGEVNRIPLASGFSGNLRTLSLIDLLRTVRDRRLRGRLELSVSDETFVLYLEGSYLEDIDNLSGPVEQMLLDVLYERGFLNREKHTELLRLYSAGDMMQPLEMRLTSDGIVTEEELREARTERARRLFRHVCGARDGTFAFLEVHQGDGQPWPVNPLRIYIDEMLLEIMREASIDTGDSRATARTRLVLDATRAAAVNPMHLTPQERDVLQFFREGETVGEARERLETSGHTPEEINRIVDRLKKLELLKRSSPNIRVPSEVKERASDTVVSERSDIISRMEEARSRSDESEDDHEKTTSLKPSHEIGPSEIDDIPPGDIEDVGPGFEVDPDDVQTTNLRPSEMDEDSLAELEDDMDRVIDEAISHYERESSEALDDDDDSD